MAKWTIGSYPFAEGSLTTFAYDRSGSFALSLKGDRGDTSRLLVLNGSCEAVFDGTFEGDVRTLDHAEGVLAFLSGSEIYRIDTSGDITTETTELSGVRDLLVTGGGRVAAVLGDSARIVDFSQGE